MVAPNNPIAHDGAEHPVVRCGGLRKEFGSTVALDEVDIGVRRGELVALLGSSGSGKSTLLRCLNGLHQPTGGQVDVLGTRVDQAPSPQLRKLRTRIGFVFQQFNLVGRLTTMENVLIGALGRIRWPRYGVSTYPRAMRRQAWEHLDRVGLADQAYQRADTLSGGQQQRVAIARTLMQRPALVLADEPVASLDPENSSAILELLREVGIADELTVIASLHQVEPALDWAGRVIGLRDGRKVLDKPATSLTKAEAMEIYRGADVTGFESRFQPDTRPSQPDPTVSAQS